MLILGPFPLHAISNPFLVNSIPCKFSAPLSETQLKILELFSDIDTRTGQWAGNSSASAFCWSLLEDAQYWCWPAAVPSRLMSGTGFWLGSSAMLHMMQHQLHCV